MDWIQGKLIGILKALLLLIVDNSKFICLSAALLSLIIYIAGEKKAGRYVSMSVIIYFLLQSLRGVLKWRV